MTYRSNAPAMKSKVRQAVDAGLIAAAEYAVATMKVKIAANYFTGGAYSTGHLLNHIHRSEPFTKDGKRTILYGVGSGAMYALFWELGFYKWPSFYIESQKRWVTITRFPLKWYRVELWVPSFFEMQPRFREVFLRGATAVMQA